MSSGPPHSRSLSRTRLHSSSSPPPPPPPPHSTLVDTAVAHSGIEAFASGTPLGVDLLYRYDHPDPTLEEAQRPSSPFIKDPFAEPAPQASAAHTPFDASGLPSPPRCTASEDEDHLAWSRNLPWWKRPSHAVLRLLVVIVALSTGLTVPVRVEFFDQLACELLHSPPTSGAARLPTSTAASAAVSLSALVQRRATDGVLAPHLPHGPDNPALCHSPAVLAASASLQMRLTVVGGLLSVLTTGWWSGRSDRLGRRSVMKWGALGSVISASIFVITAIVPRHRLPGGPNFLLLGPIVEGLAGGMPASMAAFSAYISDATPAGTKAMGYSMFLGLFFIAMAIGPIIGGRIVAESGLVPVFYVATALMALYLTLILLVLPESCSPSNMAHARKQHEELVSRDRAQLDRALDAATRWTHKLWAYLVFHASRLFQPLTVLVPPKIQIGSPAQEDSEASSVESSTMPYATRQASAPSMLGSIGSTEANACVSHVSRRWKRDYNLLLVAAAMWFEASVMGVLASKMLYAQQHFRWGAPEMGSFLTAAALSRVLALTFIVPLAIKLFHRPARRIVLPQDDSSQEVELDHDGRPLQPPQIPSQQGFATVENSSSAAERDVPARESASSAPDVEEIELAWAARAKLLRLLHDSRLDLRVARTSMTIAVLCYLGTAAARSSGWFTLWTCLACLGAGAGAANSSLAVALLRDPKDAGRLFGATSTLSAIGQTVVSPVIFTRVYQATADTAYSWAIFVLAASMFGTSLMLLSLVRVRKPRSLPTLPPRPSTGCSI